MALAAVAVGPCAGAGLEARRSCDRGSKGENGACFQRRQA